MNNKKWTHKIIPAAILSVLLVFGMAITSFAAFQYEHDPMENPKAAEDIIVDPNAVYGYSPNPDSARLGPFADYDWSDEEFVAKNRADRIAYHEQFDELHTMTNQMTEEGYSIEEIARAVSTRRNEIRLEAYKDDPEGLEKLKQSNLAKYGNENGPTPEYLYDKYGSWEIVLEKAYEANPGADACLGLYDMYYDTYDIPEDETTPEDETVPEETTPAEPESDIPKTGDDALPIILYSLLLATSAAAIAGVKIRRT